MRFFLDNDVPDDVGVILRHEGHSVTFLREAMPRHSNDRDVLSFALENELLLITCNRQDYLNLCAEKTHYGVIILVRKRSRTAEAAAILSLVRRAGQSGLAGNINFA